MWGKRLGLAGLGVTALALFGLAAFAWRLPPAPPPIVALAPPRAETEALVAALRPRRPGRPVVAVIGLNDATETADTLIPTGILRRADIADVVLVAAGPGPLRLYPALTVEPDATIAAFDAAHPAGADFVIVPAMSRDDDLRVLAFLAEQAGKGATLIAICAGAKVLAAAGLLDGRRATTHWYYRRELLRQSLADYVPDRRMVADGRVVTTTGITAAMPMMLTLVEAIGGRAKAEAVAAGLGAGAWDARHASAAFGLTRPFAATVLANEVAFWRREALAIPLEAGMDEVSLALAADAWSRTYRSRVVATAWPGARTVTANGIRVLPDRLAEGWPADRRVSTFPGVPPADALDRVLQAIAARYGVRTADAVAMQLEYARAGAIRTGSQEQTTERGNRP